MWKNEEYGREWKHHYYVRYYRDHAEEMKANAKRRYDEVHTTPEYRAHKNAYMKVYNRKRRLYDMITILFLTQRKNSTPLMDMPIEERRAELKKYVLSVIGTKDVGKPKSAL